MAVSVVYTDSKAAYCTGGDGSCNSLETPGYEVGVEIA